MIACLVFSNDVLHTMRVAAGGAHRDATHETRRAPLTDAWGRVDNLDRRVGCLGETSVAHHDVRCGRVTMLGEIMFLGVEVSACNVNMSR